MFPEKKVFLKHLRKFGIGKLSWGNHLPLDQVPLAKPLFQHFLCAPCDITTDTWETITLYLIWMLMFCWPMTLVCVSKIPSKIATEFSQKFSRLLRRAKRGTRSVKFFTKGSPRSSGWTQYPDFSHGFFSNCSIFSKGPSCKGKGEY